MTFFLKMGLFVIECSFAQSELYEIHGTTPFFTSDVYKTYQSIGKDTYKTKGFTEHTCQ